MKLTLRVCFPDPNTQQQDTHGRLLDQLATQIVKCFRGASKRGEPDLIYAEEEILRQLK